MTRRSKPEERRKKLQKAASQQPNRLNPEGGEEP